MRKQRGSANHGVRLSPQRLLRAMALRPRCRIAAAVSKASAFSQKQRSAERLQAILQIVVTAARAAPFVDRFYALERGAVVLEGRGDSASDREKLVAQLSV